MAGIDVTGFVPKTLDQIKTDLQTGYQSTFGAGIDLAPASLDGMEIAIKAERLAEVWAAALTVYNASFADGAEGVNLDNIGAITGCNRLPATRSKVDGSVVGVPGATIPATITAQIAGGGSLFIATTAGGTFLSVTPIIYEFIAVDTGPKLCPAGTLNVLINPTAGSGVLTSVVNVLDQKIVGTNLETDTAYRLRRDSSLRSLGNASIASLRSKVLAVANVTDCFVFENTTSATDANGVPSHAIEVVAAGGLDLDVANTIYATKAAGIQMYGTSTQAVTDANGFSQNVLFSRPAALNIWINLSIRVDPATFPSNGDTTIKAAFAAWGLVNLHTGSSVVSSIMLRDALDGIPGILEFVTLPLIGLSNPATVSTTITATNRQRANLDTSRITITHV